MPTSPLQRRRPRRAFTLLEIMIAVAIIAVLGSMAYIGGRAVLRSSRENDTRVRLETARSITNEFFQATAKNAASRPQPSNWPFNQIDGVTVLSFGPNDPATLLNFWINPNYVESGLMPGRQEGERIVPLQAPGVYDRGATNEPYQFYYTRVALSIMSRLPSIQTTLGSLPSESREKAGTIPNPPTVGGSYPAVNALHLLDSWGNPMLFVTPGGLMGVKIDKQDYYTKDNPLLPPDGKPFWASAGEDGDFTTGDDNLYSFGK